MSEKCRCGWWALLLVPVGIGVLFLLVWVIQLLWNGVLAVVFPPVPVIGYWQAAGLAILSRLLFGRGFGCHCRPRERFREKIKRHFQGGSCDQLPEEPQAAAEETA